MPAPDKANLHAGALDRVRAALKLASRESARLPEDQDSWRWVSVALISALQNALVLALSGYETAELEDVLDPSDPDRQRFAPVSLLLRRARSADHLAPPERLSLPVSASKGAEKLLTFRNAVLHGGLLDTDIELERAARHTVSILAHLLFEYPAFDPKAHPLVLPHIQDHFAALCRNLDALS